MKSSSDQSTSTSPNNVSIDHSNKSQTTKSNVSPFRVPSGKPSPRKSQNQSPGVSSITSPLSKDSISSTSTKSVSSGYLGSISSLSSSASGFTPPGSVTASMGGQSLSMERTVDSLPPNEPDVSVHIDDSKKIDVNSSVDSETSNANNNNESGRSSVHSRCTTTTTEDEEDGSGGVGGMSTVLPNDPSPEFDITSRDADVSNLAEETSSNNDTTPSVNPKVVQTFTGALTNEDVSIDLVNKGEEEHENVNQKVDRERDKEKVVSKLMDVDDTAGDRESKESSSSDVIIILVEERNKNIEEEKEKVKEKVNVMVEEVDLDKKKIEEENEDVREVEKEVIMIEEDEKEQEKEDEMEEENEDDDGEKDKEEEMEEEKEDDDGEEEKGMEKEIDDGEDEKEKEEEKEVDVEKKEDDDEEEMEIEERNSTKMMVDEENEKMIENDNDIDDDETLDLHDEPVDKDTGTNSTQMSFVLQLSPSQSQATQLHVGCTVSESQVLNPQSGDLARLIPKPQSQATQLVCTVSDSQVSNPGDLARPIPEPVYESLQYSTVDTLQSIPTHISTNTNEPDPKVVGVVEGGVHPVDSELSSSGTLYIHVSIICLYALHYGS